MPFVRLPAFQVVATDSRTNKPRMPVVVADCGQLGLEVEEEEEEEGAAAKTGASWPNLGYMAIRLMVWF